jgi:hypothetical protein
LTKWPEHPRNVKPDEQDAILASDTPVIALHFQVRTCQLPFLEPYLPSYLQPGAGPGSTRMQLARMKMREMLPLIVT